MFCEKTETSTSNQSCARLAGLEAICGCAKNFLGPKAWFWPGLGQLFKHVLAFHVKAPKNRLLQLLILPHSTRCTRSIRPIRLGARAPQGRRRRPRSRRPRSPAERAARPPAASAASPGRSLARSARGPVAATTRCWFNAEGVQSQSKSQRTMLPLSGWFLGSLIWFGLIDQTILAPDYSCDGE